MYNKKQDLLSAKIILYTSILQQRLKEEKWPFSHFKAEKTALATFQKRFPMRGSSWPPRNIFNHFQTLALASLFPPFFLPFLLSTITARLSW
jgi:hypothetical protein